jgi:hypothetical protein
LGKKADKKAGEISQNASPERVTIERMDLFF